MENGNIFLSNVALCFKSCYSFVFVVCFIFTRTLILKNKAFLQFAKSDMLSIKQLDVN